jgi:alpha-L-fucosidase 2
MVNDKAGAYNIQLLPALPSAWSTGKVTGLRARGGFEVAMQWKDGRLVRADIRANKAGPCVVHYGDKQRIMQANPGGLYRLNGDLDVQ